MSTVTKLTLTCDRCGKKTEVLESRHEPQWGEISSKIYPKAARVDAGPTGDICPDCWSAFLIWWKP